MVIGGHMYERYAMGMLERNGKEWGQGKMLLAEDSNTEDGREDDYDNID